VAYRFQRDLEDSSLDSYLQSATAPPFHATDYLSIVARFRAGNAVDNHTLVTLRLTDTNTKQNLYLLRACGGLSGDPIRFAAFYEGTEYYVQSTAAFSANTWHTVIATANNTDRKLNISLDGGTFVTQTIAKLPNGTPWFVQISGLVYYRAISGSMAELALYNCDLSASAYADDVASLVKGFSPARVRPPNLIAYWPLVRGLQDVRGGCTLAAYNNPDVVEHCRVIS